LILSKFSLEDKIAIITGSGRGIGKGIALSFARAGAHVVTCARTLEQAQATSAEIRELGRRSIAIQVDVREGDQVENLVQETVKAFGRLDVIVNNAGGGFHVPVLAMSERAWDALIRENMRPVFICCKAAARVMTEQKGGSMINISSIAGMGGSAGSSAYAAAKAAVINMTESMALEWAPYQVRVNCIAPGTIVTQGFLDTNEDPEALKARVPLARFGYPEDVGMAAVFLASDAANYVTGETLVVDGGLRL